MEFILAVTVLALLARYTSPAFDNKPKDKIVDTKPIGQ